MNLIAGSSGFIGGHFVEYLFEKGEISKGIIRKGSYIKLMDKFGVQGSEADLLDASTLVEAVEGVDVVYNLVSPVPNSEEKSDYLRINVEGTRNLVEAAHNARAKAFVHLSTLDVYGFNRGPIMDEGPQTSPSHPYQAAKLEAERVILDFAKQNTDMVTTIIRAARAVGSRDDTLALPLLRMAESGKVILPFKSDKPMSFSHPKDIAQALYNVANMRPSRNVYLIKSFDATITELVEAIVNGSGKHAETKYQGIVVGRSLLPSYTTSQLKASLLLSDQKTWQEIGYSPAYNLERLGEEVGDWYKKEPWVTEEV